jgi:hypothetical protein
MDEFKRVNPDDLPAEGTVVLLDRQTQRLVRLPLAAAEEAIKLGTHETFKVGEPLPAHNTVTGNAAEHYTESAVAEQLRALNAERRQLVARLTEVDTLIGHLSLIHSR